VTARRLALGEGAAGEIVAGELGALVAFAVALIAGGEKVGVHGLEVGQFGERDSGRLRGGGHGNHSSTSLRAARFSPTAGVPIDPTIPQTLA
jgi:hypothetical protein